MFMNHEGFAPFAGYGAAVVVFWALMWIAILTLVWFGIRTWGQRHSAGTQTSTSGDDALAIL